MEKIKINGNDKYPVFSQNSVATHGYITLNYKIQNSKLTCNVLYVIIPFSFYIFIQLIFKKRE